MNAYVQEKIAKYEKDKKEREKYMEGQVQNYKKSLSYNRKLFSNKTSQNQSKKQSRGNSAKARNFAKNKKPKIFIINNSKKPPKRNMPVQMVGNSQYNSERNKTPKIDFGKKANRGKSMLDDLMRGKKISEILRDDEEPVKNVPRVAVVVADPTRLERVQEVVYKRASIDKHGTKGKKKMMAGKSPNIHLRRKSQKPPSKPKIQVRPTKASLAYQSRNHRKRAGPISSKSKKRKSKNKFKSILDNQRPNKQKFIGKLQQEYMKRISAYHNLDSKFKEMEQKRKEVKKEQDRGLMTSYFDDDTESMQSFHEEIVQDMDEIISQNDRMVEQLAKKEANSLAKTKRQKEVNSISEKRKKIKKDFGEWFTEDYFEKCLKLEGEFGAEDPVREPEGASVVQSESGREKQIHEIQKDFQNKLEIEEEIHSSDSEPIISLNVSSNEKLPLSFSNGYTISNKRNKFGRKIKRMLEFGSRVWRRNISERNEFKYESRINFDENSGSVRLTVFFNRLRVALNQMKMKNQSNKGRSKRSKSCDFLWSDRLSKKDIGRQDPLRNVYVNKKMGRNSSCIKALKKKQEVHDHSDGRFFSIK